jgi:hypothetical protein
MNLLLVVLFAVDIAVFALIGAGIGKLRERVRDGVRWSVVLGCVGVLAFGLVGIQVWKHDAYKEALWRLSAPMPGSLAAMERGVEYRAPESQGYSADWTCFAWGTIGGFGLAAVGWIVIAAGKDTQQRHLSPVTNTSPTHSRAASPNSDDFEQQLRKLVKLKEDGVITEDEFERKKRSILDGVS